MSTRTSVLLKYKTSLGKQFIVRMNNSRTNLTTTHINTGATMLLNANPFDATIGSLTSFIGADRVRVTTEKLI
jgi:hypothetical protein